ncbi:MAG TPA: TlpA disulfide reductase family protein [Methylomirabilota bacterium]|nr:TlpA disulfide reductase family protein [Methylomirabilota bacterium]
MKNLRLSHLFIFVGIFVALNLSAQEKINWLPMKDGFVKTNGEWVTIGGIMVKTNSPLNTDYFKQFKWRDEQLDKIMNSGASNATDRLVEGAWTLIKDYPKEANGYQFIMGATEDYEYLGNLDKARALANELVASSAPEKYKLWTKGFLNRLDSHGKSVSLQFTAVDGREVDLAQMRGKVVLVDFWGTHCGPCVAELPRVKAALKNFHAQGFEVIGISCDTDKKELEEYVKQHDISWPQYFDGKQQNDNKFTVEFGIDGIPHMFLVDKKGFLRFDNVRARDDVHPKGDTISFEGKISKLLAE